MERTLSKILALMIAAALFCSAAPAGAFGADGREGGQGAEVDEVMGSFTDDGSGYTDVSILSMRTDFHIIAQSPTWSTDDPDAGVWVQVYGGHGPYRVTWQRQLLDPSGKPWGDPEVVVADAGDPSADPEAVFRTDPTDLKARASYHYWAEVTDLGAGADAAVASNADDPILVINHGGYRPGPLVWPDAPDWTWSAEGFIEQDDGTDNGATGAIYNKAVLDAAVLGEQSLSRERLQQAAADAGHALEDAWHLILSNTDEDVRAFIDTISVRLDITPYVQGILDDDSMTPSQKEQAIARAVSIWHVSDLETGQPRRISASAPDGLTIYLTDQPDGAQRAFASFIMDDDPYGASGDLGCFAVALDKGHLYSVTLAAPRNGQAAPAGVTRYAAGDEPVFMLYPDAGYRVDRVLMDGEPLPADAVHANWCKLPPMTADAALTVEYAPAASLADPVPDAFDVTVRAQADGDDGGESSVSVVAHGAQAGPFASDGKPHGAGALPAMKPVLLEFAPAQGFAAASVTVAYQDGSADDYLCRGNALTIPALIGAASIDVTFAPAIEEPEATQQASIEVTTAGAHLVAREPVRQPTSYGGCAVFALRVDPGYALEDIKVTRAGAAADDSAAVYEQDGQDARLYLYNVVSDVRAELSYRGAAAEGPGDGSGSGGAAGDGEVGYHKLNVTVIGGHGLVSIDGESYYEQLQAKVRHDAAPTIFLKRDLGYSLYRVTVDGEPVRAGQASVRLPAMTADADVVVEFRKTAAAGANNAAVRAVKTLQALAKTGDLQGPAALALISAASGCAGVVFLMASRRREEEAEEAA